METVHSLNAFIGNIEEKEAVLAYFSHSKCSVCKVLKPKLSENISLLFPRIHQVYVDVELHPEIAAQYTVFTVPVIVVFFEGKEIFRKARVIGIEELLSKLKRPYQLLFD